MLTVTPRITPGSSLLSLPLWIPGQSLPGDVAGRLREGVTNPMRQKERNWLITDVFDVG